jgi:HEAT repeat protein
MEPLVRALADDHPPVRKAAAEALGKIDPDWPTSSRIAEALELLAWGLRQTGGQGQVAVEALALVGPAAVPVLLRELAAGDRIGAEAAAMTLGLMGPRAQSAVPQLVETLQTSPTWLRAAAAEALQRIDPERAAALQQRKATVG